MRVLCLGESDERTRAVAACMRRLVGAGAESGSHSDEADICRARVQALRSSGRLSSDANGDGARSGLNYVPSTAAKRALFVPDAQHGWPRRVEKYMRQELQPIAGAVFRLPLYGGDDILEAFITDWSPVPAACAIAIHPSHPLADSCDNEPGRWTGRYARHVLTGDLLAIWTAGWVRPEFGTGMVIVNPAHSEADLAFARAVGLPIRFGLAATTPPSTDPATWLDPPVVNTGYAMRTGIADGEAAGAARRMYFERLEAAGHAYSFTDHAVPPLRIGSTTDVRDLADLELRDPVRQILTQPLEESDIVVASAAGIADLVGLRALHVDSHACDMPASGIVLVQPAAADGLGGEASPGRELALVGFGRLDEVLTLKGPQVEQAERFYANHEKVPPPEPADVCETPKRVDRLLGNARSGQTALAFNELYKLQRDLRQKRESVGKGDRYAYFLAAHVLAGTTLRRS